jgi:hypothetical protein
VDAPLLTPHDLVRPWKRATLVASAIAAIELALIVGAAGLMLAKPLSHAIRKEATAAVVPRPAAAPTKTIEAAIERTKAPAGKARPRGHVRIMVFNGNGLSGAAGSEAAKLQHLGYKVAGTGNARRQDYATSVVMYRPGFRAEGMRLAKEIGVKVVGPLDGIAKSTLHGGELVVIVGS